MSSFELFDEFGDTGMLVVGGEDLDTCFRREADDADRRDERLLSVGNPNRLLERDALVAAATGHLSMERTLDVVEDPIN